MKDIFWGKSEAIHPDDCDEIVSKYSNDLQKAGVAGGNDSPVRKSQIRWVLDQPVIDVVKYWAFLMNKEGFAFDLYNTSPDVQFTEYNSEYFGHYGYHVDTIFDKEMLFERKLSVVIQLTDPEEYEGGDFFMRTSDSEDFILTERFPELKKKGSVITFPSFFEHKVSPVTKGKRNSLVSWIDGPLWR